MSRERCALDPSNAEIDATALVPDTGITNVDPATKAAGTHSALLGTCPVHARKVLPYVRVRITAQIVPTAKAETFTYTLPEEIAKAPAVAAPHQTYILSAMVKDFVSDADIPIIKQGGGKALTVWGVVTYDDIFGQSHTTKFAQWLFWYPNQVVYGLYIPGQNDMD
jgi:hypothetical protein